MASRSTEPRCHHCHGRGKLKPSRHDPNNMLCGKCLNRFGGKGAVSNRSAVLRRARRPSLR